MFRNDPLLLFIITLGVACSIGGVPPILERIRRRNIENDLPAMLEALSFDKNFLIQALTHKSFNPNENNEKIEFLGDRVLG